MRLFSQHFPGPFPLRYNPSPKNTILIQDSRPQKAIEKQRTYQKERGALHPASIFLKCNYFRGGHSLSTDKYQTDLKAHKGTCPLSKSISLMVLLNLQQTSESFNSVCQYSLKLLCSIISVMQFVEKIDHYYTGIDSQNEQLNTGQEVPQKLSAS